MTFEEEVIRRTISRLLSGEDYRADIIHVINASFFDFAVRFLSLVVEAKHNNSGVIDMNWYKDYFIDSQDFAPDESAVFAGINKKTVTNIYGTSSKAAMHEAAIFSFEYLNSMLSSFADGSPIDLTMTIGTRDGNVHVNLSLPESLFVINVLATKKLQLRGGAWSAIGKKVEKPLVDELCRLSGVPAENIDNTTFKRDKSLDVDREVDYYLISRQGRRYRVEVKLMGKGNPESADVVIARDTKILIADTLSEQDMSQLALRGTEYLMLRNNHFILDNFRKILYRLDIPHTGR